MLTTGVLSTAISAVREQYCNGLTKNAGHEIDGPFFEAFARHEIAGRENEGPIRNKRTPPNIRINVTLC